MSRASAAIAKSLLICGFMADFILCVWRGDSASANGRASAFEPLADARWLKDQWGMFSAPAGEPAGSAVIQRRGLGLNLPMTAMRPSIPSRMPPRKTPTPASVILPLLSSGAPSSVDKVRLMVESPMSVYE